MITIIQDTWDEDDDQDLLSFLREKNFQFQVLNKNQILDLKEFENINVIFADTDIMQELLSTKGRANLIIPDNYPDFSNKEFDSSLNKGFNFYNRNIFKSSVNDLKNLSFPYFVKPFKNNKSFEAYIIENLKDYNFAMKNVIVDEYVYVSELVKFYNEYRLFIGNKEIVEMIESSQFLINDQDYIKNLPPPPEFLQEIIKNNKIDFCVIDVGFCKNLKTGKKDWCVVEVNPAFAINSYGMDIEKYYNFCVEAFKFFKQV